MSRYDRYDCDYDRCDDRESCGGAASGCAGCEDCIKEVRAYSGHTARKAHHGLLPGDRYLRTTGFEYQEGGGKRLGYITPRVERTGFGPLHAPVLVGLGFTAPAFAVPAVAQERAALAARYAEVRKRVDGWRFTVEEANDLLARARTVSAEVEAFVAAHDADGKLNLRALMRAGGASAMVSRAERNAVEARKAEDARKAEEARKALAAEWYATGGAYKAEGERVTFAGREYVLGPRWTKWVAHSNMEYMGESVDGEVVSGRNLLCPETGAVLLRWNDKRGYPVPA